MEPGSKREITAGESDTGNVFMSLRKLLNDNTHSRKYKSQAGSEVVVPTHSISGQLLFSFSHSCVSDS